MDFSLKLNCDDTIVREIVLGAPDMMWEYIFLELSLFHLKYWQ